MASSVKGRHSRVRKVLRRFLQRPGTVDLRPYHTLLEPIGEQEERIAELTDTELTEAAQALRDTEPGKREPFARRELIELCALGREAAKRALDERPFDVQLLGMQALLAGRVAEMATGEGKTLVGALAAVGFALRGKHVDVVAVNDYLARRDAEWMRPIYDLLGVSVQWVAPEQTAAERRAAYRAEVTYVSVSELGFDVLRDRRCTDVAELVAATPEVALVDEADSVLVDEARVPLVLAGAAREGEADTHLAKIVSSLREGAHYKVDDDGRNAYLTERGSHLVERELGVDLYEEEQLPTLAKINLALHAHALLHRDVDYIVRDGKVELINESRGRVARLQRWPDGLHAAVEAKERLQVSDTGDILDTITVQALISRFPTVCGMTGTAVAVGEQLREFYALEVAVIPPNTPCIREDEPDRVYLRSEDKEAELIKEVADQHAAGRPVLVGTLDVAESERLAKKLAGQDLPCVVLNAKNDAEEAAIIAEAGASGAITVSTQMAGRGIDIRLGGSKASAEREKVADLGGLYVIGSGRYSSSRLDDQLRGRAGRQGDPGGSVFLISMEDELVTQYAPDADAGGRPDEEGRLAGKRVQQIVEHAQRVAEGAHLQIHRNTWRYNHLIEKQRRIVDEYRERVLRTDAAADHVQQECPERYEALTAELGADAVARAARLITLYHLDKGWSEHLALLTDVREGIHLRVLGRESPLDEFHRSAIEAFRELVADSRARTVETFQTVEITTDGVDLAEAGLQRPSATWTYVVHDNPFGSELDRAMGKFASLARPRRAGRSG